MKVEMKRIYASPLGTCDEGKIIDLPVAEARGLIAAGVAKEVVEDMRQAAALATIAQSETAMKAGPSERAVKPKGKPAKTETIIGSHAA